MPIPNIDEMNEVLNLQHSALEFALQLDKPIQVRRYTKANHDAVKDHNLYTIN